MFCIKKKIIKFKGKSSSTLVADDLDALGPILSASLPIDRVKAINPDSFASRLDYFSDLCFQLSASESAAFSPYIE